jgi:hypothetical protein
MAIFDAIDVVCNLVTPREIRLDQVGLDPETFDQTRFPKKFRNGVPLRDYMKIMDRAGVKRSLLIAVRAGDLREKGSFEVPYRRVRDVCQRYPDRFSGLAGIDPTRGVKGLKDLEKAVNEYGFVGAHVYPHWFRQPPNNAIYYPYYAKCCELKIPIQVQVGQNLNYRRSRAFPTVDFPIALDRVAIDFPDLRILGIHMGYPWTDEMISMAWKHENIYIGSDAYAPRYWPDSFVHYINTYGQDKVLFGTDWPLMTPERAVSEIQELQLRAIPKRKLLRDNALKLYGLKR